MKNIFLVAFLFVFQFNFLAGSPVFSLCGIKKLDAEKNIKSVNQNSSDESSKIEGNKNKDPRETEEDSKNKDIKTSSIEKFVPDHHFKEQLPEDLELLKEMRTLFFESEKGVLAKKIVREKAIREYGAQELMLLTDDGFRLSSLYRKVENSPVNIIYVTGYFHDLTPTKEWALPFLKVFPNFNILSFDWRGYGCSEGRKGRWSKNDFGKRAYPDIQAAIDFFRKENDRPIVLVGFCFGAAMVLRATVKAQKQGKSTADALVLNSIFTEFENQFTRSCLAEDRKLKKIFMGVVLKLRLGHLMLDSLLNGSLFKLKPIEMIEHIKVPCYFEHFIGDPFAIVEEGIEVFNKTEPFKMFTLSDLGRHVRMHSKVPYQYRLAFYDFLVKSKLVKKEKLDFSSDKKI